MAVVDSVVSNQCTKVFVPVQGAPGSAFFGTTTMGLGYGLKLL